jgi:methylenetetrahydrofolate reductase (NADPH)
MLGEARQFAEQHKGHTAGFQLGVASVLGPLPAWKREADFLFAQVGFSVDQLLRWRSSLDFAGPVYAGVMVVPSAQMAAKLTAEFPQLAVPRWLVERTETDRDAGVELACDMVCAIRASGAFDGVHLIPVRRYRDVARRLEAVL